MSLRMSMVVLAAAGLVGCGESPIEPAPASPSTATPTPTDASPTKPPSTPAPKTPAPKTLEPRLLKGQPLSHWLAMSQDLDDAQKVIAISAIGEFLVTKEHRLEAESRLVELTGKGTKLAIRMAAAQKLLLFGHLREIADVTMECIARRNTDSDTFVFLSLSIPFCAKKMTHAERDQAALFMSQWIPIPKYFGSVAPAIVACEEDACQAIGILLSGDDATAARACLIASLIGPKAAPCKAEIVNRFEKYIERSRGDVRNAILQAYVGALYSIDPLELLPFTHHRDADVKAMSTTILGPIDHAIEGKVMNAIRLLSTFVPSIRIKAAKELQAIGHPAKRALPDLHKLAGDERAPKAVREAAASAIPVIAKRVEK